MVKELIFAMVVIFTLISALLTVSLKRIFYNALSLIATLFGLACLFIYLESEFLAVMEVIIYIGAIAVAIIFAIMLSVPPTVTIPKRSPKKILKSGLVSLFIFMTLVRFLLRTHWPHNEIKIADNSARHIGELILAQYPLAFEVISLVLLVAILGAILISRDTGETK